MTIADREGCFTETRSNPDALLISRGHPTVGEDPVWFQRRYLSVESMQLILSAGWTEKNSLEQQHHQEVAELNAA